MPKCTTAIYAFHPYSLPLHYDTLQPPSPPPRPPATIFKPQPTLGLSVAQSPRTHGPHFAIWRALAPDAALNSCALAVWGGGTLQKNQFSADLAPYSDVAAVGQGDAVWVVKNRVPYASSREASRVGDTVVCRSGS